MNVLWIAAAAIYLSVALAGLAAFLVCAEDTSRRRLKRALAITAFWPLALMWAPVVLMDRWLRRKETRCVPDTVAFRLVGQRDGWYFHGDPPPAPRGHLWVRRRIYRETEERCVSCAEAGRLLGSGDGWRRLNKPAQMGSMWVQREL
jgi:hypothetical protein